MLHVNCCRSVNQTSASQLADPTNKGRLKAQALNGNHSAVNVKTRSKSVSNSTPRPPVVPFKNSFRNKEVLIDNWYEERDECNRANVKLEQSITKSSFIQIHKEHYNKGAFAIRMNLIEGGF